VYRPLSIRLCKILSRIGYSVYCVCHLRGAENLRFYRIFKFKLHGGACIMETKLKADAQLQICSYATKSLLSSNGLIAISRSQTSLLQKHNGQKQTPNFSSVARAELGMVIKDIRTILAPQKRFGILCILSAPVCE